MGTGTMSPGNAMQQNLTSGRVFYKMLWRLRVKSWKTAWRRTPFLTTSMEGGTAEEAREQKSGDGTWLALATTLRVSLRPKRQALGQCARGSEPFTRAPEETTAQAGIPGL